MTYQVTVIAESAPRETFASARARYCSTLETELGGPSQVVPCFRAWAKGKQHGERSLSQDENSRSAAWILADHAATAAGNSVLGHRGEFVVQILSSEA